VSKLFNYMLSGPRERAFSSHWKSCVR